MPPRMGRGLLDSIVLRYAQLSKKMLLIGYGRFQIARTALPRLIADIRELREAGNNMRDELSAIDASGETVNLGLIDKWDVLVGPPSEGRKG